MKEQYIKQVEKELSLPHKAKKEGIHRRNTPSMYKQRTSNPIRIIRSVIIGSTKRIHYIRTALYR